MNIKTLGVGILATFVFTVSSCNNNNGKKPEPEPTPDPTILPTYDPYDPSTAGVAQNHIVSFNTDLKGDQYGMIGSSYTIVPTINNPTTIPEKEKIVTYEIDKPNLIDYEVTSDYKCNFTLKNEGTVNITAFSYEKRLNRKLTMHIMSEKDTYDLYAPDFSLTSNLDAAKEMFGYKNNERPNGFSNGIITLGRHTWQFSREKTAAIASKKSCGVKFGSGTEGKNEGAMSFKTHFNYPVKAITFFVSSQAAVVEDESGHKSNLDYGSVEVVAKMNGKELDRTVEYKTYKAGSICHTAKGEEPDSVYINCEGQSGDFSFELSASLGYTYFKGVAIEFENHDHPIDESSEVTSALELNSETTVFTPSLAKTPKESISENEYFTAKFNKARVSDGVVDTKYAMAGNSAVEIYLKDPKYSIKSISFKGSKNVPSTKTFSEEDNESLDFSESYSKNNYFVKTRSSKNEVSNFICYGDGVRSARISYNAKNQSTLLGLESISVVLTTVYGESSLDHTEVIGSPMKVNWNVGQKFDSTGALILAHYKDMGTTGFKYNPMPIFDSLIEWPSLTLGATSITGTTESFGSITISGITVDEYIGQKWIKATSFSVDKQYIIATVDGSKVLNCNVTADEIKTDKSCINATCTDGQIQGNLTIDSAYLTFTKSTDHKYRAKNNSLKYLGVTSANLLTIQNSASRYFDTKVTSDGVELIDAGQNQAAELKSDLFGLSQVTPFIFRFVDMSQEGALAPLKAVLYEAIA